MSQLFCPYCMNPVEANSPCKNCGLTSGNYNPAPHHLPPGTVLRDRYLIGRVLGEGGFGITYIGCDLQLELKVAIKEYFPTDKANRISQSSLSVSSYSGTAGQRYDEGKSRFLQEARTMAKMDKQPVIVSARDFFEANNTAYIVMEYVEGTTLKDLVSQRGGKLEVDELFRILEPLFSALSVMHSKGLIHRDISPENLMLEQGAIRLLDFGCAREPADGNATLTIALKHGYAPIEQYQNKGQGPWTDVYALSATIYFCLTGIKPPQAMDRLCEDELILPRKLGIPLTEKQEKALLCGMGIRPRRRFRSVEELKAALYNEDAVLPDFVDELLPRPSEYLDDPAYTIAEDDKTVAASVEMSFGYTAADNDLTVPAQQDMAYYAPVNRSNEAASSPESEVQPSDFTMPEAKDYDFAGEKDISGTAAQEEKAAKPRKKKGLLFAVILLVALAVLIPMFLSGGGDTLELPTDVEYVPAYNSEELMALINDESVKAVTIPEGADIEHFGYLGDDSVFNYITLNKPLRVEPNAQLVLNSSFTVGDGGILGVDGEVRVEGMLRTMGSGAVGVFDGGNLSSYEALIWLEEESDLYAARGSNVEIDTRPSHYIVLDEERLFSKATHVNNLSEYEAAIYNPNTVSVVVDGSIVLTSGNRYTQVPVMISESGSIQAYWRRNEIHDASLCLGGTVFINRGKFYGSINNLREDEGAVTVINYGELWCDYYLENEAGAFINLGNMNSSGGQCKAGGFYNLSYIQYNHIDENILLESSGDGWTSFLNCFAHNMGVIDLLCDHEGGFERGIELCDGAFLRNSGMMNFYRNSYLNSYGYIANYGIIDFDAPNRESNIHFSNQGIIENYGPGTLDARMTHPHLPGAIVYQREETVLLPDDCDSKGLFSMTGAAEASNEVGLRALLEDDSVSSIVVYEDLEINGDLNINKGLTVHGRLDVKGGNLYIDGENAYLVAVNDSSVDGEVHIRNNAGFASIIGQFSCNSLYVSDNSFAVFRHSLLVNPDGTVDVSADSRLMLCACSDFKELSLNISDNGEMFTFDDLNLEGCHVNIQENAWLTSRVRLYLSDNSSLVNHGHLRIESLPGWEQDIRGSLLNEGQLDVCTGVRLGGELVNTGFIQITDWAGIIIDGKFLNDGKINAATGAFVEGTVNGNPVNTDQEFVW